MRLPDHIIDAVIDTALAEDLPSLDVTTDNLIDESSRAAARLVAKAPGVLCGVDFAQRVFRRLDNTTVFTDLHADGDTVSPGEVIMCVEGNTRALLKAERTALNLLQHLSGIATKTAQLVALIDGTGTVLADTRKTLPGLRVLQKYAVTVGGGRNHRFNLSDAAMIKDNHIAALGGIAPAVAALRAKAGHMVKIEVETTDLTEVREAAEAGADVIMLDNMPPDVMRKAVKLVAGRALTEASGNLNENTLRAAAEAGVDILSVGALTHSVTALDISMKIAAKPS